MRRRQYFSEISLLGYVRRRSFLSRRAGRLCGLGALALRGRRRRPQSALRALAAASPRRCPEGRRRHDARVKAKRCEPLLEAPHAEAARGDDESAPLKAPRRRRLLVVSVARRRGSRNATSPRHGASVKRIVDDERLIDDEATKGDDATVDGDDDISRTAATPRSLRRSEHRLEEDAGRRCFLRLLVFVKEQITDLLTGLEAALALDAKEARRRRAGLRRHARTVEEPEEDFELPRRRWSPGRRAAEINVANIAAPSFHGPPICDRVPRRHKACLHDAVPKNFFTGGAAGRAGRMGLVVDDGHKSLVLAALVVVDDGATNVHVKFLRVGDGNEVLAANVAVVVALVVPVGVVIVEVRRVVAAGDVRRFPVAARRRTRATPPAPAPAAKGPRRRLRLVLR